MFENMLGRVALAVDLTSYVRRDIPVAVMTIMADGRNTGSEDPNVRYKIKLFIIYIPFIILNYTK